MAGGIGGLLNLKQNSQDYSYLYDGRGNVMNVVKDSDESIAASYRYDIFRKPLKKTGTFDQPYRFSTKRYDEQTGLSYYGYRFYNPTIGRWMTRDPHGEAGGINLYGFLGNNPVSFVDPWGLWTWQGEAIYVSGGLYKAGKGYLSVKLKTHRGIYDYEAEYSVHVKGLSVGSPLGATRSTFQMQDGYYGDKPDALRMEGFASIANASVAFRSLGLSIGILTMGDGVANISGLTKGLDCSADAFVGESTLKKFKKTNTLTDEVYIYEGYGQWSK
jgi:RHS repeat-associated protein